jgi:hypothetical protein
VTELVALYKLVGGWRGLIGIIGIATLSILLVIQKGETRHWHKKSDQFEQLYNREHMAFGQTVLNYRDAAEKARAADKANADRVLAEQAAINKERDASYEARIADARARAERAERLRNSEAGTHPGGSGAAPVPGSGPASGGPNDLPTEDRLSDSDALIATEQAIQLDELQRWVKGIVKIDRTGAGSSPSSLTGNH